MSHHIFPRYDPGDFQLYRYHPSTAASVLFIVLFFITTLLHGYQMIRTRTWFMVPFFLGGVAEVIGYIARTINATEAYREWTLGPYIITSVFTLIAPALFSGSIYMELGRITDVIKGQRFLFIRRKWLTKIFVAGDIISFLTQGAGAGLLSSKNADTINNGKYIVVGGLLVQLSFFAVFLLSAGLFQRRMRKQPTEESQIVPWTKHMLAMYFVSVLIVIRNIYRVIEFLQGINGYLMSHEVFLYIFDSVLMLFVMITMNVIHPSEIRSYQKGGIWCEGPLLRKPVGPLSADLETAREDAEKAPSVSTGQ